MGTVFIAGIYGVGKSTLCQQLSQKLNIQAYSAGDLISSINGEQYKISKTVSDKRNNQEILVTQVDKLLKINSKILLAGHFCIFDTNNNVDCLPDTIFYKLRIEQIILLEATTLDILKNILSRDKKKYLPKQILALQNMERKKAKQISHKLGCNLYIHNMKYDETDAIICSLNIKKEEKL